MLSPAISPTSCELDPNKEDLPWKISLPTRNNTKLIAIAAAATPDFSLIFVINAIIRINNCFYALFCSCVLNKETQNNHISSSKARVNLLKPFLNSVKIGPQFFDRSLSSAKDARCASQNNRRRCVL